MHPNKSCHHHGQYELILIQPCLKMPQQTHPVNLHDGHFLNFPGALLPHCLRRSAAPQNMSYRFIFELTNRAQRVLTNMFTVEVILGWEQVRTYLPHEIFQHSMCVQSPNPLPKCLLSSMIRAFTTHLFTPSLLNEISTSYRKYSLFRGFLHQSVWMSSKAQRNVAYVFDFFWGENGLDEIKIPLAGPLIYKR